MSHAGVTDIRAAIAAAREEAARLYTSPGFRGAYVKGTIAAGLGHARTSCPYRTSGKTSWRAAWRGAWLRGFDDVTAAR